MVNAWIEGAVSTLPEIGCQSEPHHPAEALVAFRDLAARLEAWRLDLELTPLPIRPAKRGPPRPGFFLRSTFGAALRRVSCEQAEICQERCSCPISCAVGRVLESHRRPDAKWKTDSLCRLVVQAPWSWQPSPRPTIASLVLLSPAERDLELASMALHSGLLSAAGRAYGVDLVPAGPWERVPPPPATAGISPLRIELSLATPWKLPLRTAAPARFDAGQFLRRTARRISSWAFDLQHLSWPDFTPILDSEVPAVHVTRDETRVVDADRWSASQGRKVTQRGLLGSVEMSGVGPGTELILRLAETCGVPRGTSSGLGRIAITSSSSEEADR